MNHSRVRDFAYNTILQLNVIYIINAKGLQLLIFDKVLTFRQCLVGGRNVALNQYHILYEMK